MEFVPPALRDEQVPCRFVDLGGGVTVDSLYRCGTPAETEEILTKWLQARIREIEFELSQEGEWSHKVGTGTPKDKIA